MLCQLAGEETLAVPRNYLTHCVFVFERAWGVVAWRGVVIEDNDKSVLYPAPLIQQ